MKYIFTVLLLTTALFSSVEWQTNYHKALEIAQEKNKRVYMLIVSDNCRWCMKFKRITIDPKQMGSVPCIRNLRIPIATIIGMLAEGMTEEEILKMYPDLEPEDIRERKCNSL